ALAPHVLEVRLGHAGPEALGVAVAEIGVRLAGRVLRVRRAAAAARGGVATLAADGVRDDVATAPLLEHPAVHHHGTGLGDVTDPFTRLSGALPARIDVGEGIDDVHRGMGAAERRAELCDRPVLTIEDPARLPRDRVVRELDATEPWIALLELLHGSP